MEDLYFAKLVGKSVIAFAKKRIKIGIAADIGCGRGDLIEHLVNAGHDVFAVDQSPASVDQVSKRFAGNPHFKGAALVSGKIELPDGSVDTAFILEVVEHLSDEALAASLNEAHRILRAGGHVVITTPNEEDLRRSETMCPDCGSVFHTMQHVRCWTAQSLSRHVEGFGFRTVVAEPTILSPYSGPMAIAYRLAYAAVRRRRPNLVYIGRRV